MDLAAVARELDGPRAERAWAVMEQEARSLVRRNPSIDDVLALRPWLMRTFDPRADALLQQALATHQDRRGELELLVGTRAAQRAELALAASKARVARALGAPSAEIDLLDVHVSIRMGELTRARTRVEERARRDPRMRVQHAFFLLASGRHEDAAAIARRVGRSESPLVRGAAEFFLTESAVRQGAWEQVLFHGPRSRREVAFMGVQTHDVAVAIWEARALRYLRRPDMASARARWSHAVALRAGLGEAMAAAALELVELGTDRMRWLDELVALRSAVCRPELRSRVDAILGERDDRTIEIDADGRWLRVDGRRVDLARRYALQRIVRTLARSTGALGVEEIFRAGWPDEAIRIESRQARVYTAIWQLRRLGLPVEHAETGYRLGPVRVR